MDKFIECSCGTILPERHLMTVGLYCLNCNIDCLKLSKNVLSRVTFMIYDNNKIICIGTTRSLYDQLNTYTYILQHTVRISLLHSEFIMCRLLGFTQIGNTEMTLGNKELDYHNLSYKYAPALVDVNGTSSKNRYFSCGILFAPVHEISYDLNRWQLSSCTPQLKKNIDYSLGIDYPIKSIDFLLSAVSRNTNIAPTTKLAYQKTIKLLIKLGFLTIDYNELIPFLTSIFETYPYSRNMLTLSTLRVLFNQLTPIEQYNFWGYNWYAIKQTFIEFATNYKQPSTANIKSDHDTRNWIEYPHLLEILEKEKQIICAKQKNNTLNYNHFQHYIALMLHLKQTAVRNDYCSVLLWNYNKETDNYICKEKFVFNHYKTSKFFGRIEIPIKEDVKEELLPLLEYRRKTDCNFLFVGYSNNQINSLSYSKMLTKYTRKLTGKSIGSSLIRKIYVSWLRRSELDFEESKQVARYMMHSETLQRSLYRLIN